MLCEVFGICFPPFLSFVIRPCRRNLMLCHETVLSICWPPFFTFFKFILDLVAFTALLFVIL